MIKEKAQKLFLPIMLMGFFIQPLVAKDRDFFQPALKRDFIKAAKENPYWKIAYLTGENGQVVFMNISPKTNPKNEIGEEIHDFDQFIWIVEGKGKTLIHGETFLVNEGDLLFFPEGTPHNLINLNKGKALKIISFYSENDMSEGDVYKTSKDQPLHAI